MKCTADTIFRDAAFGASFNNQLCLPSGSMEYDGQETLLLVAVPMLRVCSSYWANPNQCVPKAANFSGNLRAGRGGVGTASRVVRIWMAAAAESSVELFLNSLPEGLWFVPDTQPAMAGPSAGIAQR